MKVLFHPIASDDVERQFRYYLLTLNLPQIAIRFRNSVRLTVQFLRQNPRIGPHYRTKNPDLQNLRSWPVTGFEAIRIYYLVDEEVLQVVRILHGKRDVKGILEREEGT